ncbi:MAG: pilus assembly protein N-terminal domain-containing protein [Alphaproteobacteria bacterium]|nr:pilus assembly protein N-terminal domain-containing protein [Alphaproteobacteria bacterium]
MSKLNLLAASALCVTQLWSASLAVAGAPLTIQTDQTQLIALTTEPGTVVVGNPSIADVSVNGKQVFMHGRAFGDTNVMILDVNGNQVANFDVTVTHSANNEVALFSATSGKDARAARFSYSCDPLCMRVMIPGDDYETFKNIVAMNTSKSGLATGNKSADVSAPPQAPQ